MILYIYGAGGHGRAVADMVKFHPENRYVEILFLDSNPEVKISGGIPVHREIEPLGRVFFAVGDNYARKELFEEYMGHFYVNIEAGRIIDEHAGVNRGRLYGVGSYRGNGVSVGRGTILNTGSIVEHDCEVGDFCHIAPGAVLCGGVTVGDLAFVGANASVRQGVTIGKGAVVGMGAVVLEDVPDGVTVVGNPARVLKKRDVSGDYVESKEYRLDTSLELSRMFVESADKNIKKHVQEVGA